MQRLSFSRLAQLVGDDNIRIQNLLNDITNIRLKGKGHSAESVITFATSQEFVRPSHVLNRKSAPFVGIVAWFPSALVEQAQRGELTAESLPAQVIAGGWRAIRDGYPKGRAVLATNNLHARDAYGSMSHVWIGFIQESDNRDEGFMLYNEADRRVIHLTHWHPLPCDELAR
jgi:hypothetical protein